MKALKNILGATAIAVAFSSCLKDKKIDDQEYGMINYDKEKIVELPSNPTHVRSIALDYKDEVLEIDLVPVGVASDLPATEDITVQLTMANSNAQIAEYNASNGTSLIPLPSSIYTLLGSGLSAVIPKGSRTMFVKARLNAINFDPSATYGLGFTIASVDKQGYKISDNFGKILIMLGAKNKYDGRYQLTGFHNRPTLDAPYNEEMYMITLGANAVYFFWPVVNSPGHPIAGGTSWYGGGFSPALYFNTTTNAIINVVNYPAPGNPPFTLGPATDSRYDPVTKTIYAQFYYNNNLQRMFSDTLRYLGPRP